VARAFARISKGGRLVIPVEFRRALDMAEGVAVALTLEDGSLRVRTRQEGIRRAQELIAKYNLHPEKSMVDELIAERLEEARKEEME
jgi:bifunctional DNA-binding transcriptional regulator/antitoxin component of YhaV-PrlF toxin-antitoxin module